MLEKYFCAVNLIILEYNFIGERVYLSFYCRKIKHQKCSSYKHVNVLVHKLLLQIISYMLHE